MAHRKTPGKFVDSAEAVGSQWIDAIAPESNKATLDALRRIPAVQLVGDGKRELPMHITVGGEFMPNGVEAVFKAGDQRDIPLIIGTNADEGTMAIDQGYSDEQQFHATVEHTYGEAADALLALYSSDAAEIRDAANQFLTDAWFLRATRVVLDGMNAVSAPAYQYHFTRVSRENVLGAHHGAEIAYAFNNPNSLFVGNAVDPDTVDEALAAAMISYWTQFAQTGDPNTEGLVEWPAYDRQTRAYLELRDTITAGSALGSERLDQLDAILTR